MNHFISRAAMALLVVFSAAGVRAQTATNSSPKLAYVIPSLYGADGLVLPNPDHEAHFDSSFQENFGPFNTAIASQLSTLPLPSAASGFTYTFDPVLGVYNRSAVSFGPVLAERAETLGKGKFFAGFAYQQFRFSNFDDIDLHRFPTVYGHLQTTPDPIIREDVITANNFLDAQIGQSTAFFTYGLADRLDLSVAVPLVSAQVTMVSDAKIQRIGTGSDTTIHYFLDSSGVSTDHKRFTSAGTASGLGDVLIRLKLAAINHGNVRLALGVDGRMPTGDPYNFLGSGAEGVKPFAALSFRTGRVSPHLNVAYQWNGSSPLAGDLRNGTKGHLPNQIAYAAGFDAGITKSFTLAFDLLGQEILKSKGLRRTPFTAANGQVFYQTEFFTKDTRILNGSAGFKVNPISTLLVSANFIFKLNDEGLRARVVPLIGLSYAF